MPTTAPGVFGATFCSKCGQRVRSPSHTCQPSAVKKFNRLNQWAKKSIAAGQPVKKK